MASEEASKLADLALQIAQVATLDGEFVLRSGQVSDRQDISGRRITFIEDVITTGGAVADAFNVASEEKAMVLGVVCAIWRGENEPHIVDVPTLPVKSIFTRADLEQAILRSAARNS